MYKQMKTSHETKDGEGRTYYSRLSCVLCPSSDAMCYYPWNGETHCFSCNKGTKGEYNMNDKLDGVTERDKTETPFEDLPVLTSNKWTTVMAPLYQRKITKETCEKYNVRSDIDEEGNLVKIRFPYYSYDDKLVSTKHNIPAQGLEKKKYFSEGDMPKAMLFGQTKFQHSWKAVTITEGELDAMSAHQMLGNNAPCVSLKNGAQSVKASMSNVQIYDWLNSFEKIVVSFDNDEKGQEAVKELVELFPPEKVHIMKMDRKDANDYLKNDDEERFKKAWYAAKPAILDGLINLKESREHALKPANIQKIDYPWLKINELTRGIRMGEATTVLSGTGQGKTTLMQELVWHLLQSTKFNIGCMFIENTERDTVNNIVGTAMSYPLKFALENDETYQEAVFNYDARYGEGSFVKERDKALEATVDSGRLWSVADTDYTVNNMDKILSRCRYFAKVLGCKIIFLDHISLLVSGGEYEGDERKALDEIATKLAMIVKELNIHLFIVSQANTPTGKSLEEGGRTSVNGVRGTRGIGHITHNMIGIERNGQAEDPVERNTTTLRVLKCRWTGRTGPSSALLFDHETYRMKEIFPDDDAPLDSNLTEGTEEV